MVDTFTGIDQTAKTISLQSGKTLSYDYAVLTMGSEPNYFGIAGLEEHAKSFLSIGKALSLHQYFLSTLQQAKNLPEDQAKALLHTVIVGAGPSGVELAGVLRPYLIAQAKKIKLNPAYITVDLLDGMPRILPAIPVSASQKVESQLKKKGVIFYANQGVTAYDGNVLSITDKNSGTEVKKEIATSTVIWTAGTKISSAFSLIPNVVMTDRRRVQVSETLTLPNDDSVFIAGDGSGTPVSGLAQTAIDQGKYVGEAIALKVQGSFVIPVGAYWGIFNHKDTVMGGIIPYMIRIAADLRYFLSISSLGQTFGMLRRKKN